MRIDDDSVASPAHRIPVRLYHPSPDTARSDAAILWIHGGAFVGGSMDMPESDAPCRAFAAAGITAVAVDYRLAPTFGSRAQRRVDAVRFPLPLDDCVEAWRWTVERVRELGVTGRMFVGGASAGGALASTLVLRLRRQEGPLPAGVLLAYPLLHAELPPLPPDVRRSIRGWRRIGTFNRGAVRWMGRNYVGGSSLDRLTEAFPDVHDLDRFPPTLIVDSERDTLRASSTDFAAALRRHQVPVTHLMEPGTRHGHLNRENSTAQRRTLARMVAWVGA
jgi:xylan 1,4-beta-xylosidase